MTILSKTSYIERNLLLKAGFLAVLVAFLGIQTGCVQKASVRVSGAPSASPAATETPTSTESPTATPTAAATNLLFGQSNFTANSGLAGGLNGIAQAAYIFTNGTKFIMSEPGRHRVKLWNSIPTALDSPDVILGQTDLFSVSANAGATVPAANTLYGPSGIWTDGTKLIVADRSNNRVLIWNTWPTTNMQAADVVVGQPDFATATSSQLTQQYLYLPYAVNVIAGKLVVSDSQNLRVMVWNSIPTTNFAAADMVWGQVDFVTRSSTTNNKTVYSSQSPVQYAGGKIIVSSGNRSRIAFFNGIPTASDPTIEFVIGQPGVTAQDTGSPECIATFTGSCLGSGGLYWPNIHSDGTRLFVSDQLYNRILVWNNSPTAANAPPDVVLGQSDFSGALPNAGGVSASSLSHPGHMTSTSTHLYVVDEYNNRILRFSLASLTANNVAADAVLGIDSSTRGATATVGNDSMSPEGVFKLGTKMAIADAASNRVLLYNTVPAADDVTPDVVLGQSNFVRAGANAGGISASSLYEPTAVTLVGDGTDVGTKVIVSDTSNNRLLIWNTWPTSNKQAADVVVGQSAFTTNTANSPARSATTLSAPGQTWSDGTKLLVADTNNNRVLYFSSIPTTNGAGANYVLGQTTMAGATNTCNATNLRAPTGVWSDGTKIYVSNTNANQNRVVMWSAFPGANGVDASAVLGQTDLTTCTAQSASATSFNLPKHIFGFGTRLAVVDSSNNRILIWNTLPTTNNQAADIVLGQTSFTGSGSNASTQMGLSSPTGIWIDGTTVIVGDKSNKAVRTWKQFPAANGASYDAVNSWLCTATTGWCQSGVVPSASSATAHGGNAAVVIGGKLVVADSDRNRVLVWNTFPTASNTPADVVLGQANFSAANPNGNYQQAPTASSLWYPSALATDGTRLFVNDSKNNRILVWNTVPTSNNAAADLVLGQSSFGTRYSNPNGTLTAADLNGPTGLDISGSKLIVSDSKNNRVLIWNTLPTSSYTAADVILGQTSSSARLENRGASALAGTLKRPGGVVVDSTGRLLVSDTGNNRVLVWNAIPTTAAANADVVLGQADFTSVSANQGGSLVDSSLSAPTTLSAFDGKIAVYDSGNGRTLVWTESSIATNASAVSLINGAGVGTSLPAAPSETNYRALGRVVSHGIYRIIPEGFRLLLLPQ